MPITDENLEAMFTFGTETGGVVDQPPFRMLILGDWSGDAEKKDLDDRRLLEIDRDNFDEAIRKMGASVNLGLGEEQEVSLRFTELFIRIVFLNKSRFLPNFATCANG